MRFLSERLRAMYYLPVVRSLSPPDAGTTQLETRSVRQSAVEWLFHAICRDASPANMPHSNKKIIKVDALRALGNVRDGWIASQHSYQGNTKRRTKNMHQKLERAAQIIGYLVLLVVAIDLIVIGFKLFLGIKVVSWITPTLIALTAILPVVIAALSGLLSQSECQPLSERAASMQRLLGCLLYTSPSPRDS